MKDSATTDSQLDLDKVIVCPQCDAVFQLVRPQHGERAKCQRCHKVLIAPRRNAGLHIIAVALSVLFLIIGAAIFPFLTIDAAGQQKCGFHPWMRLWRSRVGR